jgi:enoyl-CoA hydratase/carnithine racemase
MKCKTPQSMHRDMILFSVRYNATELQALGVVDAAVPSSEVRNVATTRACELCQGGRFVGQRYRETLQQTKRKMYKVAVDSFESEGVEGMGFGEGEWDSDGKVVKRATSTRSVGSTLARHKTASLL